jgi:hypothetical protein
MKPFFLAAALFLQFAVFAQSPCEFSTNVNDSIGSTKTTKDFIAYEKNFGGSSTYLFLSLTLMDQMPLLNIKVITKSKDFIKANCIDKNSRAYIQLDNGKIITLLAGDNEDCGTSVRDDNSNNIRLQTGLFMFMKNSIEELKSSKMSLLRIRYATETVDYYIKSEIVSELTKETYHPQSYFIDTLHCIDN